jgi:hypothetical protein
MQIKIRHKYGILIVICGVNLIVFWNASQPYSTLDSRRAFAEVCGAVITPSGCMPSDVILTGTSVQKRSWRVIPAARMCALPILTGFNVPFPAENIPTVERHCTVDFVDSAGALRISKVVGPGSPSEFDCTPITKLSENVIILIEIETDIKDWTLPFDVGIADVINAGTSTAPKPIGSRDNRGFVVVFADQQIWQLSKDIPANILVKYLVVNQALNQPREVGLGAYVLTKE